MKKRPIFHKIAIPVMLWMGLELLLFLGMILGQGVIRELRQNERAVVDEQTVSRKEFIENEMLNHWMDLESCVTDINAQTLRFLQRRGLTASSLDSDDGLAAELLEYLAPRIITMQSRNQVTGTYIILNTEDLTAAESGTALHAKQGVYIRSNAPGRGRESYSNLLMLRGPVSVAQHLRITLDSLWDIDFDFRREGIDYQSYPFFYRPFDTAYRNKKGYSWQDCGLWSGPTKLYHDAQDAIYYSVPLILPDGTVYGVCGIDITISYLQKLLSSTELDGNGSYFLGQPDSEREGAYRTVAGQNSGTWISGTEEGCLIPDRKNFYIHEEALSLYNNYTPFYEERWVLAAVVPKRNLYAFVNRFFWMLFFATGLTLLTGTAGSILLSYEIQLPISKLIQELREKGAEGAGMLQETGIREIDMLSDTVAKLSRDAMEYEQKFSRILRMASNGIAGFMAEGEKSSVFLTDSFFSIFGMPERETRGVSAAAFREWLREMEEHRVLTETDWDGTLYQVKVGEQQRYVHLRLLTAGGIQYGLAEDVTSRILEKRVLSYERDHDALTGLLNRRAFRRQLDLLFRQNPSKLGLAVFLMLDLDNLKYVNDHYGHDYGDRYIQKAARTLESCTAARGFCSRISGDEFNLFFYGLGSREELERRVEQLREQLRSAFILLPDGREQPVQASGGIACYPEDSRSIDELSRFADFAMYSVKRLHKGDLHFFDRESYLCMNDYSFKAASLTRLLSEREVFYAMQPILSAESGEVFGYEALMRPMNPGFRSVGEVMETAKREGKLNQIEELTWEMSLERVCELKEGGVIPEESYIFINSISNQWSGRLLYAEQLQRLRTGMDRIVLEVTEEENIDGTIWEAKRECLERLGWRTALDDYGTGYNSEKMLLLINPDFIKVDLEIVRSIDSDPDKQAIFRNIVGYAHERGKFIIAEGIETKEELETVICLGADYLQGFFLANPERYPKPVPEEKRRLIQELFRLSGGERVFPDYLKI